VKREAIVLAAGRGERLGGPKALLLVADASGVEVPLARLHVDALLAADVQRVFVVAREPVARRLAPLLPPRAALVHSHAADALGPAGSLAAAAGLLDPRAFVVVTPVDAAPASRDVVEALFEALAGAVDARAARPVFAGRGGHPVLLAPGALERYLEPEPPILRAHLRALGLVDVPVEDASVCVDLDTEADVRAYIGGAPRFHRPRSA